MSRATAVQALIEQLKLLPAHVHGQRAHYVQRDSVMAIADELAALLLREGPPQEPTEATESSADWQPIEDVLEGPREIIGYNGDGAAGEAPPEAMPDHCENCRAELPVTTVHLCHACLPSAPREDAGDAPATEPEKPCADGHVWSNQFGDDWTPEVGTPCDCREKIWRGSGAVALAASQAGTAPREDKS